MPLPYYSYIEPKLINHRIYTKDIKNKKLRKKLKGRV